MPARAAASCSLGVRTETRASRPSSSGRAGAGLRTTGTPISPAFRTAASTVASGDSSWTRTISAAANASPAASTSAAERSALAPEATEMLFSPRSSTVIKAMPEGDAGARATKRVSIPSASKAARARAPNSSSPTRATKVTRPPARAAATAWLAPLPPAAMENSPPRTVSPGRGMRGTRMIMSVLELPTTRTLVTYSPSATPRPRPQPRGAAPCPGRRARRATGRPRPSQERPRRRPGRAPSDPL